MIAQIDAYELIGHIERLVAIETAAIVRIEEGAERRRGSIAMAEQIMAHIKGRKPETATNIDYASGIAPVESY